MPRSTSSSAASHSILTTPPAMPATWRQSIGSRAATGQLIFCAAVRGHQATSPVLTLFDGYAYWALRCKDFSLSTCHQIARRWQHTIDYLDKTKTALLALLFTDVHGDELRLIPQADPTTSPPDFIRHALAEARATLTSRISSSRRKTRGPVFPATLHMTDPHHLYAMLAALIEDGDVPASLFYLSHNCSTDLMTFYDPDTPPRPRPRVRFTPPRSHQTIPSPASSAYVHWSSLLVACEVAGDTPLGFITAVRTRTHTTLNIAVPRLLLQEYHLSEEILLNAAEHGFTCDTHYDFPDHWMLL